MRERGFTLIEILISTSLMALIMVSGYACLNAAFASQKMIEPRVEVFQKARVALDLIGADLRSACPLSKDYDFLGMHRMLGDVEADNLDFGTHNYTPHRRSEGDFCQTSIFLQQNPKTGEYSLWRRRNPRFGTDPLSGGVKTELVSGLRGAKFEYYDGLEWYDSWGDVEGRGKAQTSNRERSNLSGLPEAVRMTLWFDPNPAAKKAATEKTERSEPPFEFQTVVRLNLAAAARNSSSAASGNADTTAAQPDAGIPAQTQ